MRVLLSDGSGLTSRQCAPLLARAGHAVAILAPGPWVLARTCRAVRRWHRVPRYGDDPLGWAEAALRVLDTGAYDVLLPTQEQVAVLSLLADEVTGRGVATAVPSFAALRRVQDKLNAEELLCELGLQRPESFVAHTPSSCAPWALPSYLKAPIGTASAGVRYATSRSDLGAAVTALQAQGAFDLGGVLVQQPLAGPLLMVQAVFDSGELLAASANQRDRHGYSGGASLKTNVALGSLAADLERIGATLSWHGALSLDAIDTPEGPIIIDLNPRLVEPGNAAAAGLDLIEVLLDVAQRRPPRRRPEPQTGVRTTQLLLALLGGATTPTPRRAVLAELTHAATATGAYRSSREELTPLASDPLAAAAIATLAAALLIKPGAHTRLAGGSVADYALTANGWTTLLNAA